MEDMAVSFWKGRRVLVPVDKLTYIEIAEAEGRRVGFGAAM